MSSYSINNISQLNLLLNIDNKKNIENIQIIINDLKELIEILSFKISDISMSTQQQISENATKLNQQLKQEILHYSGNIKINTKDSNPVVTYYY